MENFDLAIEYVFNNEKGYVNDPDDPGGETNLGITRDLLIKYQEEHPEAATWTIPTLTKDQAKEIYRDFFWEPMRLDELIFIAAQLILDCAVNRGQTAALVNAQVAAKVNPDGHIGPKTIAAINIMVANNFVKEFIRSDIHGYDEL